MLTLRKERPQVNNITLHFKELEKEEQTKFKISKRKKVLKIKTDINKTETRNAIEKVSKIKSCFLEKINKVDKTLD